MVIEELKGLLPYLLVFSSISMFIFMNVPRIRPLIRAHFDRGLDHAVRAAGAKIRIHDILLWSFYDQFLTYMEPVALFYLVATLCILLHYMFSTLTTFFCFASYTIDLLATIILTTLAVLSVHWSIRLLLNMRVVLSD